MKNKDLVNILETLPSDSEFCITINDIITGSHIADIYDIGFTLDPHGNLKLQVSVEISR